MSVGGYVIVDDFALPGCRKAVDDYRQDNGIRDSLQTVDWTGVFWHRS
jgi:hypothetical protein